MICTSASTKNKNIKLQGDVEMSKLVDKERLAKLAQALDARAKTAVAAEKERAMGVEAQLRTDVDAKVATEAYNAKVAQLVAEDERIAKLVAAETQDRKDADSALDERLAAVEGIIGEGTSGTLGEIVQQVNTNKADIATLNGAGEGSVAKAVADAKKEIEDAQADTNADFEGRIAANEAFVAAQPGVDQAQDEKITALENKFKGDNSIEKQIAAAQAKAIEEAEKKDAADRTAQASVDAAQDAKIQALEAKFEGDQSVKAQIAAAEARAKKYADDKDTADKTAQATKDKAQDDRIADLEAFEEAHTHEAIENDIDAIEAKLVGLEKDTVQAAIDQAEADAKAHAEQKIADLVDSAPDAMNTLKELATAINANKGVYDAYVEQHATAMATMKSELQAEIDADVKVVADELTKQKDAKQEGTLAHQIAQEVARAKAEEAGIRADFVAEDTKLAGRISTLEGLVVGGEGEGIEAIIGDVAKNKEDIADLKEADITLQANIDLKVAKDDYNTKVAELAKADTTLSNRIKAFEVGGAQDVAAKEARLAAAEKDIDNLQTFVAAQPGKDQAMEQAIAANKAAIEAEVGKEGVQGARDVAIKAAVDKEVTDRDAAIATALEVYSTTEEMKQIIGNVVNSLALTMENDQVVLKLGGVNGIKLASVSLDLATEDDINDIIAKLDA